MDYSKVARKLRKKMGEFSGELSQGLPKVAKRLIREMLYGIQASQSVVLTKIARTLEEDVSIKKIEERLSRQLMRRGLGEALQRNLLKKAAPLIDKDTLLILDPSDIQKKYAKKMQYLGRVRDGSEDEIGNGYMFCKVVGTEIEGSLIIPLVGRLYSSKSPDFRSENYEILEVMAEVAKAVHKRGIWVVDRGGDRKNLLVPMLENEYRFLIRLIGNRNLQYGRSEKLARQIAQECECPYAETIVKVEDGREKVYRVEFGYRPVKLPDRKETLGMVVVKGFGIEPMMLLTTEPLRRSRKVLWRLIRAYIRRWAIEESIRYIKQSYDLEDVRVLSYQSLQNMMPLVLAAAYFASVVLDAASKLKIMAGYVLKAAKRVFGIPDFHYYCIADGLTSIFMRYPGPVNQLLQNKSAQELLFRSSA